MQPFSVPLEIADGPRPARAEVSGGTAALVHQTCSDKATPRTVKARGVRISGPARQAGTPGTDACRPQEVQTCSKGNHRPRSMR